MEEEEIAKLKIRRLSQNESETSSARMKPTSIADKGRSIKLMFSHGQVTRSVRTCLRCFLVR